MGSMFAAELTACWRAGGVQYAAPAPVKQESSNWLMVGFSSWPTAMRSACVWYNSPSAPSSPLISSCVAD